MMNLGFAELLLIAATIGLLLGAPVLVRAARNTGAVVGGGIAVDTRYSLGVRQGEVAELVGLGRAGIRWRQVLFLIVADWIATLLVYNFTGNVRSVFWSAALLLSLIVAVRSFTSPVGAVLGTGAIYGGLSFALGVATAFVQTGDVASAVAWPRLLTGTLFGALSMGALQVAVGARRRWTVMFGMLVLAWVLQSYVTNALYFRDWSAQTATVALSGLARGLVQAALTVAIYWYGWLRYAGGDRLESAAKRTPATAAPQRPRRRIPHVTEFLPATMLGFVVGLPMVTLGIQATNFWQSQSASVQLMALGLPVVAAIGSLAKPRSQKTVFLAIVTAAALMTPFYLRLSLQSTAAFDGPTATSAALAEYFSIVPGVLVPFVAFVVAYEARSGIGGSRLLSWLSAGLVAIFAVACAVLASGYLQAAMTGEPLVGFASWIASQVIPTP